MKKIYESGAGRCQIPKKFMRVMKLTVFLIIALTLQVSATGFSQNSRLSINLKNSSVKEILSQIEEQTGYRFIYNNETINLDRKVDLQVDNKKVEDILDMLFSGEGIKYSITEKNLILINPLDRHASGNIVQPVNMQQNLTVKGSVTDNHGQPLPGVTVLIKGTTNGTITDADGNYVLSQIRRNMVLVFSFVGMKSQEVTFAGEPVINVQLVEETLNIEEVVAVGYGTMKKKDLTGSITQIQTEKLEKSRPATVQDILRTGIPGLSVSLSNSAEGGGSLLVRGERSLAAGTAPLIVVDGVIHTGSLLEINPLDVESVDVLKDASAAAVYGASSANGVVIITTKTGKTGKPTIRFDSSVGMVTMGANRKVYDAKGYLQYRSDLYNSSSDFATPAAYYNPTENNLAKYGVTIDEWRAYTGASSANDEKTWLERIGLSEQEIENYSNGKTYDWYDASFRTGIKQDYDFSLSGKNDRLNYYFSLGYLNSKGVIVGDEYENYRSNLKLEANVTSFLDVGLTTKFTNRTSADEATDWAYQIKYNTPFSLPYDDEGNLIAHPLGDSNIYKGYNQAYINQYRDVDAGNTSLNTTLSVKVKLPFKITYELNYSPRFSWYFYRNWESSENVDDTNNGYVERQSSKYYDWVLDNILRWDYTFHDVHHLNVTLLQNAEEHKTWEEAMEASDFVPSDALGWHYVESAVNKSITSSDTRSTGDALMARLFYSYDDRYLATLSLRRDGYSAFGNNNKRATFPSVALAWVFTNEKFFHWEPMSNGKLRVSWGKNGNRNIGIYQALSNLTTGGKYAYVDKTGTVNEVSMLYVSRMANNDLKWETTTSWNAGLDFGFFKNRINGSLDYYYMPTTDLLMARSLPDFTGFSSITTNLGKILNTGLELSVNTMNIQHNNFTWSTTFGFSTNKNEIKHLYYTYEDIVDDEGHVTGTKEVDDSSNGWFIGKDINTIWDYECTGIWQEGEEEQAALYGEQPGDAKCRDVNGDYAFSATKDKVFLGQTTPKFRWSLRNDFTIRKNLSISVNMYSYWGHKAATSSYLHNLGADNGRTNDYDEEYWTPENPSGKYARLNSTLPSNITPKLVLDKSFIRLESISLSYDLPLWVSRKINAQQIRLYGSVNNVAVWTKEWNYWDPEITGPVPRTFTVGAGLTF